jgi:transcriptional regulator with XRE-family HTH domain
MQRGWCRTLAMDGLSELGALVRRRRSDAGLSGAELARRAGVSQPSVWRVESGRRLSDVTVVERIATGLGLDSAMEQELVELARVAYGASARPRVDSGVSMITGQFGRYLLAAQLVRSFSSAAMPELLRTSGYSAAVGLRDVVSGNEADGLLADESRSLMFVLTDAALRTWPDDVDMSEQLSRLVALAERSNVGISVIRSGTRLPRMPLHGFTIADDEAVHVETFTAELTLTNPDDVAAYSGCFAIFEQAAVFGDAAVVAIARAADDFARMTRA